MEPFYHRGSNPKFPKDGDLTSDEAERLAHMLLMAAKQARELDDLCEQHDQWVEEHGEDE